jgi:histidinol-phosphate aminotransferase
MLTRRELAKRFSLVAAGIAFGGEAAYSQRRKLKGRDLSNVVLLNGNENPDGPPPESIEAMSRVLSRSGRYHDEDMDRLGEAIAKTEGIDTEQLLIGSGSSEILHAAVAAYASPKVPLITGSPSYELPVDMSTAYGFPVIKVPLTSDQAADVRKMVAAAEKARGGLIYVVNPNNPTSSITKKADIDWLIANLPPNTMALIDEAYIHFSTDPNLVSAMPYVRTKNNVIVCKTFSKIYGMAGLRAGYGCANKDVIAKLAVFRNNSIAVPAMHAARVALGLPNMVSERQQKFAKIRADVCQWLDAKGYKFIPPHGNFMMIEVHRDSRLVQDAMLDLGVAVGRPFPPYDTMLRVTIGSDSDMAKFKEVFPQVVKV